MRALQAAATLARLRPEPAPVQAKLRERYGRSLPLNETVISPVSIFNSVELVTVLNR